jgi:hypothetical protein
MRLARISAPLAAIVAVLAPAAAHAAGVLPDLEQAVPGNLQAVTDRSGAVPRFHLGFDSAVDNVGAGPLIVEARRSGSGERQMVADQLVRSDDGSVRRVERIGALEYTVSPDHRHWHYLGFDRYELRRASDYLLIAPDQKTGFCLGDRYDTVPGERISGEPQEPFYTGRCGLGQPSLLEMREGISPGYGDDYQANLEGQFVDVTGVDPGRYYLVHRVNADRKLEESDYGDNAASVLVSIEWPDGRSAAPSVKVLRRCPDREACPGAERRRPVLDRLAARRYARGALRRALGFRPRGFAFDCSRKRAGGGRWCHARGTRRGRRYSSRVGLRYERNDNSVLYASYVVDTLWRAVRCGAASACVRRPPRREGRIRIGPVAAPSSAGVPEPGERLVALDDAPLDGVGVGPVVYEVPRLVRDPLGGVGRGIAAK